MPSQQILVSFREGLKALQRADDFATLQAIIDKLVSICPSEELPLAKDAIARVIRLKQANEAMRFQSYPQALEEVDKKYRDLYIVLRTSTSNVTAPSAPTPATPQNQMAKSSPLGGLSLPTLIQWLGTKKKYLLTGGALASTVGGAFWLYKHFNTDSSEKKKKKKDDSDSKESNFDKTIRSIQKYKAFTQMVNDPNFSGDYAELMSGGKQTKKRRNSKKKDDPQKSSEWEKDEKHLMGSMDAAFNSLSTRPQLNYKLPQLPAPKNIDPRDVVDDSEPLTLKPLKRTTPKKKIKRTKKSKPRETAEVKEASSPFPSSSFPTSSSKPKKPRKPRKPRKEKSDSSPEKPKASKKPKNDAAPGRLIPIVKRTKRVKKVGS